MFSVFLVMKEVEAVEKKAAKQLFQDQFLFHFEVIMEVQKQALLLHPFLKKTIFFCFFFKKKLNYIKIFIFFIILKKFNIKLIFFFFHLFYHKIYLECQIIIFFLYIYFIYINSFSYYFFKNFLFNSN